MTELSTVLEYLEASSLENVELKNSKREHDGIYCKDTIDEGLSLLFSPPCAKGDVVENKKRKRGSFSENNTEMSLNLDFLARICKDIKLLITPAEGQVKYFKESVKVFRDCLEGLSPFDVDSVSCDDGEVYFDNLVEAFFSFLESESPHEIPIDKGTSDVPNTLNARMNDSEELSRDDELELVKQLFLSMVLSYNWSLQLLHYANSTVDIATSNPDKLDKQNILKIALGIKEANRNIVFYTSIFHQLWELFKENDSTINAVISDFMGRLTFLKHIINHEISYDPQAWNRIKSNLHSPKVDPKLTILNEDTEHGENLGLIRSEMMARINGKVSCDYLRKECDLVSQDLTQMEGKHQEMLEKIDLLKKQFQDISNMLKVEQSHVGKIMDSKRLPDPLAKLLSHLHIFSTSNPLREITFKVIRDHDYSFQMVIYAPKDLFFPSFESTKFVFPITFHIYLTDRIHVTQTSTPSLHQSICLPEKVLEMFKGAQGAENHVDEADTWGLHEFENELPNTFHQRMHYYYERASEYVWNLYILETYKSNNRDALKHLLPQELLEYDCKSTYIHKEVSTH